ncbi:MAG: DotU family type IV/VI secretion system protein [Rhodothermales bacterium]|nr:DotU family type IV/VI secretion system protein [Rhodothermales bacterium]
MGAADGQGHYLLAWFRTFYDEVVRLKQALDAGVPLAAPARLRRSAAPALSMADDALAETGHPLALPDETLELVLAVQDRLLRVLEPRERIAGRLGGDHSFRLFREAQYVMVALADEIFLRFDWRGRLLWKEHLLEAKLFRSAVAGDLFFERIEYLLREGDTTQMELAKVYLMALVLDFRGRYHDHPDPAALADLAHYRDALYTFIRQYDATLDEERPVPFPQAYDYTLAEAPLVNVPNPYRWGWVLLGIVLVFYLISWGAWRNLTDETQDALDALSRIEATR